MITAQPSYVEQLLHNSGHCISEDEAGMSLQSSIEDETGMSLSCSSTEDAAGVSLGSSTDEAGMSLPSDSSDDVMGNSYSEDLSISSSSDEGGLSIDSSSEDLVLDMSESSSFRTEELDLETVQALLPPPKHINNYLFGKYLMSEIDVAYVV